MTIPYSSPQLPFLGQIKDVTLNNVQDEDILQFNSTTQTWDNAVNEKPNLGQIQDVSLNNVQDEDILQYNSTTQTWDNTVVRNPTLGQLKDVVLNNVQDEDILEYNSTTNLWNNVVNEKPTLRQIQDVTLSNLQDEDILRFNSTTGTWNNAVNVNITLTGDDDAAVFKDSATAITAPNNGITKDATASGYTINLDTTNKYVGINKANPTSNLDVSGVCLINTIEISNNYIGNTDAGTNIRIYSHNLPDQPLVVNSTKNLADMGGFRTTEPVAVDTVYPSDKDCFYKVQLSRGMDLWSGAPFDTQKDYGWTWNFPAFQIVEYQNRAPITGAKILGRFDTDTNIAAGANLNVSFFAQDNSVFDVCIYDPVQMRSRKSGSDWIYAGAPSLWRDASRKLLFTIKWFIDGQYGNTSNNNYFRIFIYQYRSGVLLRTYHIYESPGREREPRHSGQRTFLTHTTRFSEDFDPSTDDWSASVQNDSGSPDAFRLVLANIEIACELVP
mgnify:FL=1